jgi:CheY-like chemotaxis protein
MRVRLIKKLAEMLDGVNLGAHTPGDVFDLTVPEARLLIAEGWAVSENRRKFLSAASHSNARSMAADARKLPKARRSHSRGRLSPGPAIHQSQSQRQTKRILVVEDDDDVRGLFCEALSLAGLDVAEAADGVQALRTLQGDPPDLVVLDLRLPRLSGVDIHPSFRSRNVPIVVVSGSPQDVGDLPVECLLAKPVMPDTLVETVRRCLALREPAIAQPHP